MLVRPGIDIGLQFLDHAVNLLAERDPVELIEYGLVEALAGAVGCPSGILQN